MHLADVAESARDIDFAMRWGFGASQGPFELWQAAGWSQVAQWIKERLGDSQDVFAYFNNDAQGYAVDNAKQLKQYVRG